MTEGGDRGGYGGGYRGGYRGGWRVNVLAPSDAITMMRLVTSQGISQNLEESGVDTVGILVM